MANSVRSLNVELEREGTIAHHYVVFLPYRDCKCNLKGVDKISDESEYLLPLFLSIMYLIISLCFKF